MLFGLLLLVLEIKVTSYGLLTAGGLASLVFGSMILMDSPIPELQLSLRVVLPVVLGFAGIAVFLVRLGARLPAEPAVTGVAGMIGEVGPRADRHRSRSHPDASRHTAKSGRRRRAEPIAEGARVRVTRVDGLTVSGSQGLRSRDGHSHLF